MKYNVDLAEKKKIHREYRHNCRKWMALSYGIIIIFILFNILFASYGFINKSSFIIRDITSSNCGSKIGCLQFDKADENAVLLAQLPCPKREELRQILVQNRWGS